ncbi:MAG: ABC transporter substrate-binding protein [Acidimicrobiales bacterium]
MDNDRPPPEVPERARNRAYSLAYKARVLAEYDGVGKVAKVALLRSEGLHASLISEWRRQRDRDGLKAVGSRPARVRWARRNPRARASVALLVAVSLVAAACGARIAPYLGAGQAGNSIAAGTGTGTGTGGTQPGSTTGGTQPGSTTGSSSSLSGSAQAGGGSGAASGATSGSGAGSAQTSLASLTPANFPYQPAAQAALCRGSAGNTASATGVTATTITLGNVSGITGVLANNFEQGPEAVQALFSAVNAAGGICGRQLKLLVEDDGQDAGKNAADIADEIPKVFAFVGSTSDADNGGVQEMVNANIPDIGAAINPNRGVSPVYWSTDGSTIYEQGGHPYIYNTLANGLKAAGNFPTKIAVLAYSVPISADAGQQFENMFVNAGSTSCFNDFSVSPATASLDQDVLEMKSKGCTGVITTMDVTGNAKLLEAMARQGFHPVFAGTTFDGYTPAQISLPGAAAAQGFEINLPFAPFNENNPVIDLYQSQLATYEPGRQPSGFGIEAWASAQMFLYALLKAGRSPTRASLTQAFAAIDSWNTGTATVPITPRLRRPSGPCTMAVQVKGNDFQRVWPSSGFFCNGQLVQVG